MSRESEANKVLDTIENYLNRYENFNDLQNMAGAGMSLAEAADDLNNMKVAKFGGIMSLGASVVIDVAKEDSWDKIAVGLLGDGAQFLLMKGLSAFSFGGTLLLDAGLYATGNNFGNILKGWFYGDDKLTKNNINFTANNGVLRAIMPDGTVYARPLSKNLLIKKNYNKNEFELSGSNKHDVLFGGNGNDTFNGGYGKDILIGGKGYDEYYTDDGDIIKDTDHKGSVYFSGGKLTGGKYDKSKKAYIGNNGEIYKLSGSTLKVYKGSSSITIENYSKSKNSLGITLLDQGEISITISDNEKAEGDNGEQSMNFDIKVNGEIPKGEYAIININGEEYLIGNPSTENIKKDNLNISKYKRTLTYTHKWQGNEKKEEDKKFIISGSVVKSSDGLKVKEIISGNGTIIDDDKDDSNDPENENSPIIIDLNKNGITSTKLNNTIYFDHDNNNFKEATSWIDKGDAFLALDKNSNGLIDNGNELFGNHTISNTRFKYTNNKATNGYEALKAYDLNGDNIIDSKDEIYDKLLLWKDSNQNAITDKGELIKLKDSGIVSIDLNYKNTNTDEKGNTIKQSSTVTFEDGS
ncbi:MAG: hypothetical protein E6258_08080, partial [Campylobacter ureolyticus]|nr:hypothetical protein [Campylobacter ureolyticus]